MKKFLSLIVAIMLMVSMVSSLAIAEDLDFTAPAATTEASGTRAVVTDVYVCSQTGVQIPLGQSSMDDANEVYVLQLMNDGTYELTISQAQLLYRAPATIVTICYGTYTIEKLDDSTSEIMLSAADQVVYTAYVGVNKLSVKIDTNETDSFPVALIGSNDKNMEVADIIALYGSERSFYAVKGSTNLFLQDPAN